MSRSVRRPPWWALTSALAAGALLAACATTPATVSTPQFVGTPATSISVPLSNVGCTLNDVCVAVGTAITSDGPTMVAEFGTPHGRWINLTLPGTTSPLITSSACFAAQCLLAGSEPGSDLLWRFNARDHTLETAATPTGGIGVDALSCRGEACSLVDTDAAGGATRFAFSADGGDSWSMPLAMGWATGDAVTSLACGEVAECLVGARTTTHQLILYQTLNGGVTWTERPTPSSWTNLSSLTCEERHCVALASTAGNSLLVRTGDFGKKWTVTTLANPANALACVSLSTCVVVGRQSNDRAWLANIRDTTATDARLRYVPTPLLDVACGSKLCAAIGVTTLLSVPLAAQR